MESETSVFRDEATARRSLSHLEETLGEPLSDEFLSGFAGNADPDLALINLGRWLAGTANPQVNLQQLVAVPKLARLLFTILGASQPITDSLIQNPELASLILDPAELARIPNRAAIVSEGESLLKASTSYSHSLDRIRFLKQRWTIPIVINDLAGAWPEEFVWTALSDLAEALIELACKTVWAEFGNRRDLASECPILVVGFGKLGGRELNFSSDIDLVYAIPDGMGENFEADATKFCEMLGRALSDRMGRGTVYRIDLRLRPYGSSGPIVASMRGFESYYRLYAEQWEVQALIRSKSICGPVSLAERWKALRAERCFRSNLSEPELESMVEMKSRIEERSDREDLKRGAGGIRDVEFLVQALQLIHGHRYESLQGTPTLGILRELGKLGLIEQPVVESLEKGYIFLRQLEHRCQLVGDLQTHSIPQRSSDRNRLAKLMGLGSWESLESNLQDHRRTIQTLYQSILRPGASSGSNRDTVARKLGPVAPGVLQWFDSMPSSEAFYASLEENRDSMGRVEHIALAAPRLINDFKMSVGMTEMLLSGEIEEEFDAESQIGSLATDVSIATIAEIYLRSRTLILARWVLQEHDHVWNELACLADALIRYCAKRLSIHFDIIGLGSLGAQEMSFDSDADLVFLVEDPSLQSAAELEAQEFLALFGKLKRAGADLSIDLRLRPDGGKGMLVRSHEALDVYDLSGMEMWERFALGHARLVYGSDSSIRAIRRIAYSHQLNSNSLSELVNMKQRIENERVHPQQLSREVKLGYGGLTDIEWIVHLNELSRPEVTNARSDVALAERIDILGKASLLSVLETEQLLAAHRHLIEVRLRLALLGFEKDVLPENPDKLNRLAITLGWQSGIEFSAHHQETVSTVRNIYLSSLERLKA